MNWRMLFLLSQENPLRICEIYLGLQSPKTSANFGASLLKAFCIGKGGFAY